MAMDFWNRVPFVKLIIPFIFGITGEINQWLSLGFAFFLFATTVVVFIGTSLFSKRLFWIILHRYTGYLALVIMFSGGYVLSWSNRSINHDTHFSTQNISADVRLTGVVTEPPQEKARSVKAFIEVRAYFLDQEAIPVEGKLLLYFEKSNRSLELEYGDELAFVIRPNRVGPPANPRQFDFREYLANNDTYHQGYVKEQSWKRIAVDKGNRIRSIAYNIRKEFLRVLEKHIPDEKNRAVASALVLGYKDNLDPDVLRSFSSAGAMHVLAVSGLHVGIIFLFFNFILQPIDRALPYGKWIRAAGLLFCLWSYAFVTGLSPSVLRAATMFSFIVIGTATNRPTNVYNTLAASAFLLLIVDPLMLTKVGFQLSYLAVLGIVYLQPKFYNWLFFKNWLLDKVWAITCVSFAAQIATFPLGVYYFHQFPNYFFVSNLVVIPMATLILYGGFVLVIFDSLGYPEIFATILNVFLDMLNRSVVFVENIPYALIYGNHIGVTELLLLYSSILFGLIWLALKRKVWFWMFTAQVTLLLILSGAGRFQNAHQGQFIVYQVPGKSVLNLMSGRSNILISDRDFLGDESQQLYYVRHHWFERGFVNGRMIESGSDVKLPEFVQIQGLVWFRGYRIFHLFDVKQISRIRKAVDVDVLVLSGDQYFDLDKIRYAIRFKEMVIDTSVPRRTARIVERLALKRGWRVHNVAQKAYVRSI